MSSNSKIWHTCVGKVIVFCVTPIVPESFMIVSSNYQCPGVTVPNGRRFWRALIWINSSIDYWHVTLGKSTSLKQTHTQMNHNEHAVFESLQQNCIQLGGSASIVIILYSTFQSSQRPSKIKTTERQAELLSMRTTQNVLNSMVESERGWSWPLNLPARPTTATVPSFSANVYS